MERVQNVVIKGTVVMLIVAAIMCIAMAFAPVCFAASDLAVGKNLGEWIMEQAWWIALGVVACIAIPLLAKKAWVPLIIFGIIAAIVLVIVSDPEKLLTLGNGLFSILGL